MEANKRATKGTEHTLASSNKIGGEFKKEENAPFIKERAELWDKLYAAQEEKNKSLPQEKIKIILSDGREIEGVSNVTTPSLTVPSTTLVEPSRETIIVALLSLISVIVRKSAGICFLIAFSRASSPPNAATASAGIFERESFRTALTDSSVIV